MWEWEGKNKKIVVSKWCSGSIKCLLLNRVGNFVLKQHRTIELFPKQKTSNHKRSDAFKNLLARQTSIKLPDRVCQLKSSLQSKHNIHFCDLLLQPSLSRLSETKLQLNHSKNIFNFGAYRGFLMLTAFDLCLGACGVILILVGTAIDFVVVRLDNAYPFLPRTMRSISPKNSRFFVRTCDNSSLRADRLNCLFILLLYHFWRLPDAEQRPRSRADLPRKRAKKKVATAKTAPRDIRGATRSQRQCAPLQRKPGAA